MTAYTRTESEWQQETLQSEERKTQEASSYTKNDRQLSSTESGRNSLPRGRAHQLVIQYHMVILEIQTLVALFRLSR